MPDVIGKYAQPMSIHVENYGEPFEVPPGVAFSSRVVLIGEVGSDDIGELLPNQSVNVELVADYDSHPGRFVLSSLKLTRGDGRPEITGALIRTVRVQALLRQAVAMSARASTVVGQHLLDAVINGMPLDWRDSYTERVMELYPDKPDTRAYRKENLEVVAAIYRLAVILNENPAKAVSRVMALEIRTATNWIKQARLFGVLDNAPFPAPVGARSKDGVTQWGQ